MELQEFLKNYMTDNSIIIPQSDYTIMLIESVFQAFGVDTSELTPCLEDASIHQLYYFINNQSIVNQENLGVKSLSITNYSIAYGDSSSAMSQMISPLSYQILVNCGLISSIVDYDCNPCSCL